MQFKVGDKVRCIKEEPHFLIKKGKEYTVISTAKYSVKVEYEVGLTYSYPKELFELVTEGLMNKAVAQELGISERTVELHRAQVMKKLDARTLAQLVRLKIDFERQEGDK